MANEFKIKKGLIVTGADGGTVVDIQGSQGQLFSVTDDLSGSIFAVSDISGVPILDINSSGLVTVDGPFTQTGGGATTLSGALNVNGEALAGSVTIAESAPTLTLQRIGGSNADPSGTIVFKEHATSDHFKINYDGSNDRLEFQGLIGTTVTDLVHINRNTTTPLSVLGGATFAGDIKQSTRIVLQDNGTIQWGATADYGNLTWDTGYALIYGQSGKGIKFGTNGSTLALTLDTSQNATFAGDVNIAGVTTSDGFRTDTTNSNWSLISRDSAGNSPLYVQSANSGTGQWIARFNYGSATANGGTNVLTVAKDNSYFLNTNVGIGTDSPDYKLEVQGVISSADASLQKATFANVGNDLVLTANADATNVTAKMLFNSSGAGGGAVSTKMIIDGSGNVGIGTTSPSSKLSVRNNGNQLSLQRADATGTEWKFYSWGSGLNIFPASASEIYIGRDGASTNLQLHNGILKVLGTGDSYFTGNVGIGTASPDSPLHLSQGSSNTFFKMEAYANSQGADAGINVARELVTGSKSGMSFWTNTGSSLTQKMSILGNGNVGIGTTSPGYPLEVQSGGVGTVLRAGAAFVSIDSAGTASSPSLVFNGDTNTGIFRPSSDVLAFSTASTERMRVLANGNVGIGTTNPGAKLHVIDSSSSNVLAKIRVQGGMTSGYAELGSQSNYARILSNGNLTYAATYGVSYFYVNGSAAATIDSTGMGIGTTSPSNKLVIQTPFTTSASDSYIEINSGHEASGGSDTSGASGILFKQSGSGNVLRSAGSIISGRESNYSTDNQADSYLSFLTAVNNVNTEKIRITSTGQVGFNNYTSATSFTGTAVASLAVDSSGNIITEAAGGGGGGNTTVVVDTFSGDNSDVTFNITNTIANEDNVQIYIDGVYQSKSNYSTSGATITFSTAPPSGTNNIEVTHFVQINGAPSIEVDTFNGNASTTAFTLTTAPATKNNLQIYIDGVYQAKANYSVSGTALTFTTAPATGTNNIEVTHLKIS